jgi:galactose mutarotase-like enzyme
MIHLTNKQLTVAINEKGAELQSLQLNSKEYLWQADPKYWAKHSPVLFPIVGELKDGKYIFNNKEFHLPRHGFAREKVFDVEQFSERSVTFSLLSSQETLAVYPFRFIFQLKYEIKEESLFCRYLVKNINEGDMYFSVGGHPAFKMPLQNNLQYTDYLLYFDNDTLLNRYALQNGLTKNDTTQISLDNNKLHLDTALFYNDAIVLKHINSKKIKLYTDKDPHGLNFRFEGFPYFGIWAPKDAPFVCLEPWCGIADNIHHNHLLENKEGINKIAAGESWQRTWSVELF